METKASAKYIRVSARKARLVVDLIRGKDVAEAQQILDYSDKAVARVVSKVLNSAIANAEHNNGLDLDELYVSRAYADEGPTLKRFRPRAMGRATRINKRTCHITVVLEEREPREEGKRRRFIRRPSRKRPGAAPPEETVVEPTDEEELDADLVASGAGEEVVPDEKPAGGAQEDQVTADQDDPAGEDPDSDSESED